MRRLLVTEGGAGYGLPVLGALLRGTRAPGPLGRHLDTCAYCRREADRLIAEAKLIRRAFAALPLRVDFVERVWMRIRDAHDRSPRRSSETG